MKTINTIFLTLFFGFALLAQETDAQLFETLRKADSLLFEQGFNKCNEAELQKIIHPDLEFLHDQGGKQNRAEFFESIRKNICATPDAKPIRKLVDSTLAVYPMKKNGTLYAAIQMGDHQFFTLEKGKLSRATSKAKFIHTWLLENGELKLYRVLSYDHQQAKQ